MADRAPALFRAYPALLAPGPGRLPFAPLGHFPTPVERLPGLLRDGVELWLKREEKSGPLYGGNKVRKLEFLLGEALARRAGRLITVGATGSHHVLATALYGRALGFGVDAVVYPQPPTPHVDRQLAADRAAGARLLPAPLALAPLRALLAWAADGALFIPPGGSSARGTLGYVSAGLELCEQVARGELAPPELIYVAFGSGGTLAGLLLGLAGAPSLPGIDATVVGVRVVDRPVANRLSVGRLVAATRALLRRHGVDSPPPRPFLVDDGHFAGGYGRSDAATRAAMARGAASGLTTDATYTGKALAALLADADAGRLRGRRVLFLHTLNGVDLGPLLGEKGGKLEP